MNLSNHKIVIIKYTVSTHEVVLFDQKTFEDQIKQKLALELAEKLLSDNLVFFTKQKDEFDQIIYRARAVLSTRENVSTLIDNI